MEKNKMDEKDRLDRIRKACCKDLKLIKSGKLHERTFFRPSNKIYKLYINKSK
jgi:hypothetical protein